MSGVDTQPWLNRDEEGLASALRMGLAPECGTARSIIWNERTCHTEAHVRDRRAGARTPTWRNCDEKPEPGRDALGSGGTRRVPRSHGVQHRIRVGRVRVQWRV